MTLAKYILLPYLRSFYLFFAGKRTVIAFYLRITQQLISRAGIAYLSMKPIDETFQRLRRMFFPRQILNNFTQMNTSLPQIASGAFISM